MILFSIMLVLTIIVTFISVINEVSPKRCIATFVIGAILSIISLGFYTIESGNVGVLSTLGKYDVTERDAGFHVKIPVIQSIKYVNVKQRVSQEKIPALDKNNLSIDIHTSFKWRVLDNSASEMLTKYGYNMYESLIKPSVRKTVRDTVGKYSGEDIARQREKLAADLTEILTKQFEEYDSMYFDFAGIDIRNITLDPVVMNKIKAVQIAKQREKEMENEVLQAKQEQEQRIIKADASYYEKVKEAEARAKAVLTEAQAQAEANTMISKSLTPTLIEYNKVDRWSGDLPKVTGSNEMNLFIPSEYAK